VVFKASLPDSKMAAGESRTILESNLKLVGSAGPAGRCGT